MEELKVSPHFTMVLALPDKLSATLWKLPCITGVSKDVVNGLCYEFFNSSCPVQATWGRCHAAYPGEWLAQELDGRWWLLSEDEYEEWKQGGFRLPLKTSVPCVV